jgi:hypothetical protein
MDPHLIEEQVQEFLKWIEDNPEYPQNFDKITLVRYLKAAEFDLEKAQKLFKNCLLLRTKNPHIFSDRDPKSADLQKLIKAV